MAQITINIPDDKISRVLEAYAAYYNWSADSGLTKAQFTKQQVVKQIKQIVKNVEGDTAANQHRFAVESDVESINIT